MTTSAAPPSRLLFREVQRFRQVWIFLIGALVALGAAWAFVEQVVLGRPFGTNPAPDALLWVIFVLCGLGVPALLLLARLVVEVEPQVLWLRYRPFARRRIPAAEIERFEAETYRPLRQYGGWGIRWWPGHGWAWTVSGDQGVRLHLADGKQLLVGTQRPDELVAALTAMRDA